MTNVIQLADVRRAKLDKIAAKTSATEVKLIWRIANSFGTRRARAMFLRISLSRMDTSRADGPVEEIRQALRKLGGMYENHTSRMQSAKQSRRQCRK